VSLGGEGSAKGTGGDRDLARLTIDMHLLERLGMPDVDRHVRWLGDELGHGCCRFLGGAMDGAERERSWVDHGLEMSQHNALPECPWTYFDGVDIEGRHGEVS